MEKYLDWFNIMTYDIREFTYFARLCITLTEL